MLETKRLRFKRLKSNYRDNLEKLFCENELVMSTTLKGRVFTKKEFKELLKNDFINSDNDKVGFWCITTKNTDVVIGISGLLKCNYLEEESYEFGFILNENYWGKGLATEIGNFWFDYAKKEMDLTQLIATVSPENIASKKVLEKLNMKYVDTFTSKERGKRLILRKVL